jgi:hypothetical protein
MNEEAPQRSIVSSQFIAWIFELVGYVLLVLGLPAALFGLMFFLTFDGGPGAPVDPAAVQARGWLPAAIVLTIFLFGCVLLWGYRRHAHGRNGLWGGLLLWLGTALYNGAPLIWILRSSFRIPTLSDLSLLFSLSMLLPLWWLTAVVLALIAAALDWRGRTPALSPLDRAGGS